MICKKCGTEFDGAFCPKCGERAEEKLTVCPVCGKERAEGETFCSKCGFSYENACASKEKVTRKKVDFSKVKKAFEDKYWIIPSAGRLLLGALVLLSLIAPVMTHAGVNTAGNGYVNAFGVNVTTTYTVCCAALLIAGVYTLVYGAYTLIRAFMRRYFDVGKKLYYILDGVLCVIVAVIGCIGCAGAGDWYADAGAGLSLCVFVGIAGVALLCLRILYENKWFDKKLASEDSLNSESDRTREKKLNKPYGITVSVISAALVIAIAITSVVSILYKSPFNFTASGFAETRADVIKQFGVPEGADENDSSFTYYSSEYTNIDKMIEALQTAQEEASEDIDEDIGEDFDEGDLEDAFGEDEKYEIAIDSLKEKKEKLVYKKTTVTFDNYGGIDRKGDGITSYICEVVDPEGGEKTLKSIDLSGSFYIEYEDKAILSYVAQYADGSFIKSNATLRSEHFDKEANEYVFTDSLGKYTVKYNDLTFIGKDCGYYMTGKTLHILSYFDGILEKGFDIDNVERIEIEEGLTEFDCSLMREDGTLEMIKFKNLKSMTVPSTLTSFNISPIENSKFYNDESNWDKGHVLYVGGMLVYDNEELSDYAIREGTTAINDLAFNSVEMNSLYVPESVKYVSPDSFNNCKIGQITLPATVIETFKDVKFVKFDSITVTGEGEIPESAFAGRSSLTKVIISDGVTSIGDGAFRSCSSLTSVSISASVTNIGNNVFEDCHSLADITVEEGNSTYKSAGNCLIDKSTKTLIKGFKTSIIPDDGSVTSIGAYAFAGLSTLESIAIPDGVTKIGEYAFYDCDALNDITIAGSVNYIGDHAFDNCEIVTANIPTIAIRYIPTNYLQIVEINSGETINTNAFNSCRSLTTVIISDSVTTIGYRAFFWCSALTSVTFENTQGWWISTSSSETSGTSISSSDLANPSLAAKYLTHTYDNYYWKRG